MLGVFSAAPVPGMLRFTMDRTQMKETDNIIDLVARRLEKQAASGNSAAVESGIEADSAGRLASEMDAVLVEMVGELERIASCQQDEPRLSAANDAMPPFEAFCVGLRHVGASLLPELYNRFIAACRKEGVSCRSARWIIEARSDAYIAYLVQLAQVHGLAFEGAPRMIGEAERRALALLENALRECRDAAADRMLTSEVC